MKVGIAWKHTNTLIAVMSIVNGINMYNEFLIEYDLLSNVVYLSGLDDDDFWIEEKCYDDVDDVLSFAEGLATGLKLSGETVTVQAVSID